MIIAKPLIIGIDPGLKGAIAALTPEGELVKVWDMPTVDIGKTKTRNRVSPHLFAGILDQVEIKRALIETLGLRAKESAVAAQTAGIGYGAIIGALASFYCPYQEVPPNVWKKHLKLTGAGKDQSREMAMQIWPQFSAEFKMKQDDGRAEAALLALGSIRGLY